MSITSVDARVAGRARPSAPHKKSCCAQPALSLVPQVDVPTQSTTTKPRLMTPDVLRSSPVEANMCGEPVRRDLASMTP
jgi:hypothetical protein